MSDEPVDQDLPKQFGDYTLLKPLGRGGMGQVFLARLRARGLAGVDKICVVKTLRSTNDPEYERRFIDEARLIVLLSHKNICPVFDAGCFEGQYYLALEHIAGREVRQLQQACERRGSPLPTAVVLHVMKETLEALDAAHRMAHPLTKEPLRVVHRDVSPQNVMISQEGEVKLIDFGLAVSSQKVEQTAPQVVMGKMAYMAPEQARGESVDARVDQFAAGIMLYELLTNERYYGTLPFEAMWRMSGAGGHTPERLHTLDQDLQDIVLRSTAARREQRYETCGDMRDALTAAELRRGIVAGSREVRAALADVDAGASAPAVFDLRLPTPAPQPAPMPSPSAPAPPIEPSAPFPGAAVSVTNEPHVVPALEPSGERHLEPKRERTRTFRLVVPASSTGERTEIGVVEGLEPGSLITSEEFRPVHGTLDTAFDTALQSSFGSDAQTETALPAPPALRDDATMEPAVEEKSVPLVQQRASRAGAAARSRSEATVVVRSTPTAQTHPAPPLPDGQTRSRTRLLVGAALVVAVVVSVVVIRSRRAEHPRTTPVVITSAPPSVSLTAAVIDDGVATIADGGVESADAIVDAGVARVANPADAGVDGDDPPEPPPTPTTPTKKPTKKPSAKKKLPPLPQGVLAVQSRFLMEQCNDQTCAHTLFGPNLVKKITEVGPDRVQHLIKDCYRRCEDSRR